MLECTSAASCWLLVEFYSKYISLMIKAGCFNAQAMNVSPYVQNAVKKQTSKYGLNLRPAKQKQQLPRPSLATPFGFNDDDDNDVEREIALQASKKKTLKEVC